MTTDPPVRAWASALCVSESGRPVEIRGEAELRQGRAAHHKSKSNPEGQRPVREVEAPAL